MGTNFGRHDFPPEAQCKFIRRNGEQCRRAAMRDHDYCHSHRDGTGHRPVAHAKRGANNPLFRHGRYSKYIPERLIERFNDNMQDKRILELARDIALVDTRVDELLDALEAHDGERDSYSTWFVDEDGNERDATDHPERNVMSQKGWAIIRAAWLRYEAALEGGVQKRIKDSRFELRSLIMEGREEFNVWNDIAQLLELRRKMAETEHKRQQALQQYVAVDKVLLLLGATISSIKLALDRYVSDDDARRQVIIEAEAAYRQYVSVDNGDDGAKQLMAG